MKKLIIMSILCLAFTGCGCQQTNTDNVTVETETQVESEVIESETEIESETVESENQDGSNGTYATSQFESVEEIYCQYTSIEPVTVYSKVYGSFYGDPNQFEGELGVWSAYEAGWEYVFDKTTTYEGIDYYATTFENGLIVIAQVTDFSTEPVEAEEYSYETRPATDKEIQDAEDTLEGIKQDMSDAGFTDEEIEGIWGDGVQVLTPDMDGGDSADLLEDAMDPSNWDPELLDMADGLGLYKGGN